MLRPKKGKQTGTVKKANPCVFMILRIIFKPVLYLLYNFKFNMESSKNIKPPCLILANHQTGFDQFAVGVGFNFGINYVSSDTLFRYGLKSWIMKALGRPIPFSKGNSDLRAVRNMLSVIKNGGCVGMFPSGNRSFYGEESTIVKGIGKLAKMFNVPLVLVRVWGGFFTKPRWSIKISKGKMGADVVRVVSPEEITQMADAELKELIQKELYHDDFEYNRKAEIVYHGKRKTEYLESVLFYCPECGSISGLCSEGNEFFCRDCGARVRLGDTGFFEKINNAEKIPETILEWSHRQLDYIKGFDFTGYTENSVFCDTDVTLSRAERAKKEYLLGKGSIKFYADRFNVCGQDFYFAETTMAVQGVRKLTIYNGKDVYAVEAQPRTNLMKYMICGYHLRNKILNIGEEYYGY